MKKKNSRIEKIPTIKTPRLILRPFSMNDFSGLYQMDSQEIVHEYLGKKPMVTEEEAVITIEQILKQYDTFSIGRWVVELKENETFIGWAGLKMGRKA